MAERKKPKKGKGNSQDKEGRVTLRIRNELIEELQELADNEELSLSAYVRQLLKHEVVSKKSQEREFEQYKESQKSLLAPKFNGSQRNLVV